MAAFEGLADLDQVPATPRGPALQPHRFHRMELADTAPRLLGGMGLRRGPRRATDTRTEWPTNETGSQAGLFLAV